MVYVGCRLLQAVQSRSMAKGNRDRANHLHVFFNKDLHTAFRGLCPAILTTFRPATHDRNYLFSTCFPQDHTLPRCHCAVEPPHKLSFALSVNTIKHKGPFLVIDGATSSNTMPRTFFFGREVYRITIEILWNTTLRGILEVARSLLCSKFYLSQLRRHGDIW